MKDALGQEIKGGDIIVYPRTKSTKLWMQQAVVLDLIDDKKIRVRSTTCKTNRSVRVLRKLECVVVITKQIEHGPIGLSEEEEHESVQ
jgi:hypothetical protein